MFNFLKRLFGTESKIFLTSDLHLDHTNIIKYCNRPFKNVQTMNRVLISNWNKTVGKNDIVYFLGDFCFCRKNRSRVGKLINALNGKKIFIKGNHDKYIKGRHHFILKYKGESFYLVHRPYEIPNDWKSWAIFGHTHNKGIFVDRENKRINVSTEQTRYKPISIDKIMEIIHQYD
ncbi:MAG: metallophosphoesterase [Nanoarchaeota archaeon]|nr:metallophosphoesterase [Nanoarchaeota archaeon]